MHDVLAHSLSGLLLQLEGARMLAADNPTDPRLPDAVNRAHQLGRTGLAEARRAIGTLRDDELPGPERLPALAEQFAHDHGIACRLTTTGQPRTLDPQARLALYRVAQEALTNVARHADAPDVELRLDYGASATRLTVENTGREPDPRRPAGDGGYGLTGMRERAELLGGTLTAGPTPHGFRVELDLPA
jgi:signal transduction histidine kinase